MNIYSPSCARLLKLLEDGEQLQLGQQEDVNQLELNQQEEMPT